MIYHAHNLHHTVIDRDRPVSTVVDSGRPWPPLVDICRQLSTLIDICRPLSWQTLVDLVMPRSALVDRGRRWSTVVDIVRHYRPRRYMFHNFQKVQTLLFEKLYRTAGTAGMNRHTIIIVWSIGTAILLELTQRIDSMSCYGDTITIVNTTNTVTTNNIIT